MAAIIRSRSGLSFCRPARQAAGGSCCVTLANPPDRPDPATYSQDQLLALGEVPSWDSPDIITNLDIPWTLFPETLVTVRNLSTSVAAVNTQVQVAVAAFGIGTTRTPLSNQLITLGPSASATLEFPLTQALLHGDQSIGVFVQIYHPNDAVLINSHGAQVLTGVNTLAAGRDVSITFPVVNPTSTAQTISLGVFPNALAATISPGAHAFSPFEQINATLSVSVPPGLHNTTQYATVTGRGADGGLIGAVTLVVFVND
jgi:hypothetical protein